MMVRARCIVPLHNLISAMHRFFISKSEAVKTPLSLTGTEWHHCQTVLRCKIGNMITLFDGEGTEYLTSVETMDRTGANLKLIRKTNSPRPSYSITLAQALPKGKAMDYIIQKATELGVNEIIPTFSERTVVKLEKDEIESKLTRWREISIEAAKQCGLNWLPVMNPPKTVKEVAALRRNFHLGFIGSLQPDSKPLWDYIADPSSASKNILMMIGPEGDFTPAEIGLAQGAGFLPLGLGPLVLRCDTAAIYAISTISYELRRLQKAKA